MPARNVPENLTLQQEFEIIKEVQHQLWAQHVASQWKTKVESLKQELRDLNLANHEQESVNVVHEEKVRQLKEKFARFNSY